MSTILHRLAQWAKDSPEAAAQCYRSDPKGPWKKLTVKEFRDRVYFLTLFLMEKGFSKKEVAAIYSANCPEWVHADLAVVLLGAKSSGIYPNSTSDEIRFILEHSDASVLFVQNKDAWERTLDKSGAPSRRLKLVVVFDNDVSFSPLAVAYKDAIEAGRKIARSRYKVKLSELLADVDPDEGLFMIYTSGTTGRPKGALLSLDNLTFTSDIAANYWNLPQGRGTMCSFLPLCHVAERIQNIGVGLSRRYTVTFCSKIENIAIELPQIQPTLLLSVPRLWEKMMEGALAQVERLPLPQRWMAGWALEVGARVAESRYAGKFSSPFDVAQYRVADPLILAKIRRSMGLGEAEVIASGAAALPPHVSKWFRRLGLEILEDYGQTESTGVICMTERGVESAGTVGRPVPGLEVKLAEDGEVLTRGRHVFKGYYKDPDATAKTLKEGWLYTGDLGVVTAEGTIRIQGRKKEVLKTSGGKMIAPLPIEEKLKSLPIISQVCIVGDGRKYLTALVTLSELGLKRLKIAQASQPGVIQVVDDEEIIREIKAGVDALNAELSSYEQVKRFTLLSRDFSVEGGEMTPTLKMKRNVIESRYKEVIDRMYPAVGTQKSPAIEAHSPDRA